MIREAYIKREYATDDFCEAQGTECLERRACRAGRRPQPVPWKPSFKWQTTCEHPCKNTCATIELHKVWTLDFESILQTYQATVSTEIMIKDLEDFVLVRSHFTSVEFNNKKF